MLEQCKERGVIGASRIRFLVMVVSGSLLVLAMLVVSMAAKIVVDGDIRTYNTLYVSFIIPSVIKGTGNFTPRRVEKILGRDA